MPAVASGAGRCALLRSQPWPLPFSRTELTFARTRTSRVHVITGRIATRTFTSELSFKPIGRGDRHANPLRKSRSERDLINDGGVLHQRFRSTRPGGRLSRPPNSYRPIKPGDSAFDPLVQRKLQSMSEQCKDPEFLEFLGLRNFSAEEAQEIIQSFQDDYENNPRLKDHLHESFMRDGMKGLVVQLKFALRGFIAQRNTSEKSLLTQASIADFRYPAEWYPSTRMIQRTIHLHIGPTNSGKTYHALKRLAEVNRGIYAGPLRLLAHEVYSRFKAMGKPCHLITGDERILAKDIDWGYHMAACTVEMVPVNVKVDVAVIDEIQMMAHKSRGWAWTQAFLGLQAKELHVCGEERALPLVTELAASTGDKLVVHRYKRLTPLRTMSTSLNDDLTKLRKGDCVVMFSRMGLHGMKREIEKVTKKRVAIIYGALPPEIRTQQAELFNDPDNDYDILVASDAIGMGLNLSIKRIVFETLFRREGELIKRIPPSDIKQIAGRAGRYRSAVHGRKASADGEVAGTAKSLASQSLGLVTTLSKSDLHIVRRAMETDVEPLQSAGLKPPDMIYLRFADYYPPDTPLSYIILRIHELARMHPRYFLCSPNEDVAAAEVLHTVPNLRLEDRLIFCVAPAGLRTEKGRKIFAAYARCMAERKGGNILDIPEVEIELLDSKIEANKEYVQQLEELHHALVLYMWLSFKFSGVFYARETAAHIKRLVEQKIDQALAMLVAVPGIRKSRHKKSTEDVPAIDLEDKMDEIERATTNSPSEIPYSVLEKHPELLQDPEESLIESQMQQKNQKFVHVPDNDIGEQRMQAGVS